MTSLPQCDARGLPCPLPIVRLAALLRGLASGTAVELVATDPAVEADLQAWCAATGHTLVRTRWEAGEYWAEVR